MGVVVVRRSLLVWVALMLCVSAMYAQEVLLPVAYGDKVVSSKSSQAVCLPFFDDFSNYEGVPNPALWDGNDAFVSKSFAALPPTVGVVTLDAVDANGKLHKGASTALFSADTLCSQPIRLDTLFSPQVVRLQPSDSLYLSFYYLPGGGAGAMWERNGDAPEANDSLMLEFYNPSADVWELVWSTGGWAIDSVADSITRMGRSLGTLWQYVAVPIRKAAYFSKEFRFRFRNYCSLDNVTLMGMVGNCDHWSLDYVYLHYNRTRANRSSRDVAFVAPAPSCLKDYQAMPACQFAETDMALQLPVTITNRYSQQLSSQYGYTVYNTAHQPIEFYDGGYDNVPPFFPNGNYQSAPAHATPPVAFVFPVSTAHPDTFTVVHTVREGVSGDHHTSNDTIVFRQVFDNYYAYDDGTAENGYGLTSSSSRVRLACRFALRVPDTLTAIDLYFNCTRQDENASIYFHLCVWADDGNGRPGALLYRDNARRKPRFEGLNRYCRYLLEQPVVLSGTVYVGFEQVVANYINLGFDRGNDARQHIFYLTGSEWQQSILSGALMLRPYFGAKATVGIASADHPAVGVYPNPANCHLNIAVEAPQWQVLLFDLHGRCLYRGANVQQVSVATLPEGVYLLQVSGEGFSIHQKIIIRH